MSRPSAAPHSPQSTPHLTAILLCTPPSWLQASLEHRRHRVEPTVLGLQECVNYALRGWVGVVCRGFLPQAIHVHDRCRQLWAGGLMLRKQTMYFCLLLR